MIKFIEYRNFNGYFLKFKTHLTDYLKQIFNHLSGENGLDRLDLAKYMDSSILINNSVFRLFSHKTDYFTCEDFCNCLEIIYSKSFDVSIAFVISLLDIDMEKVLNRKNCEIILYNIAGRENQKNIISLIDDFLDNFFSNNEYLDYDKFKDKTLHENSDLFLIILSYFYQKTPFNCQVLDYFYCEDYIDINETETAKPTDILKYFIKNYDNFVEFINKKEIDDDLMILNDDININYLPSLQNMKNVVNIDSPIIKPTRKEFKRNTPTNELINNNKLLDSKINSNEDSTDSSLVAESINENKLYIYNDKYISKHIVVHLGKDIIELKENNEVLINLTQSYILNDTLEVKLINNEKYYRFILYNNGKFIIIINKDKYLCLEWKQKISKYIDFIDFNKYYKIISNISESKYNLVNLGLNILTNKEVIVKMFRKYKSGYHKLELFMTELDILKNTKHPNIVEYIDSFEDKDFIYIVMEKLEISIPNYLSKNISNRHQIYPIIYQIGKGLQYLHKLGIIHRDIKIDNICMIGNYVKIIDFGLSTYISTKEKLKLKCGTKSYFSPELCLDQEYDRKTDIWSFGIVIYNLVNCILGNRNKESEIMFKVKVDSIIFNNTKFVTSNQWEGFEDLKSILSMIICKNSKRLAINELLELISNLK
jgi:hypothetical protein